MLLEQLISDLAAIEWKREARCLVPSYGLADNAYVVQCEFM
jgi:hypothetical protein